METKRKCILNLGIARELIAKGHRVVDVDMSHRRPGNVVFVFERTSDFDTNLAALSKRTGE